MKQILGRRPLMVFAVTFSIGVWTGQYVSESSIILWCITVLFLCAAIFIYGCQHSIRMYRFFEPIRLLYNYIKQWAFLYIKITNQNPEKKDKDQNEGRYIHLLDILLIIIFFIFGIISFQSRILHVAPEQYTLDNKKGLVTGRIIEEPVMKTDQITCILDQCFMSIGDSVHLITGRVFVTVYIPDKEKEKVPLLQSGQKIRIRGTVHVPLAQRNENGFDYKSYLIRREIYLTLFANRNDIVMIDQQSRYNLFTGLQSTRNKVERLIDQWMSGDEGKLLKIILLGNKTEISEDMRSDFTDAGVAHILGISGLQVGYIVLFSEFILLLLHIQQIPRYFIHVLILFSYTIFSGGTPAVVRAVIMALILLGGRILGRKNDALTSLSAALLIILLLNPLDLFDAGFQLSFGAVMGIYILDPVCTKWFVKLPRWIRQSLSITVAAQLGVLPITIFYFNKLSLISPLANLLIVPISGIVMLLGLCVTVLAAIWMPLTQTLSWLVKIILDFMMVSTTFFARIPFSSIVLPSVNGFMIFLYYSLLCVMSSYVNLRFPKRIYLSIFIVSIMISMLLIPVLLRNDTVLEVIFIDVGQGDSTLIVLPGGGTTLIDGGGNLKREGTTFDTGKDVLVPFLIKRGIFDIDHMIVTHGHTDHVGGLFAVLETIPVHQIICPDMKSKNDLIFDQFINLAKQKKVPIYYASQGDEIKNHDFELQVLYPDSSLHDSKIFQNPNNSSLVIQIKYNSFSLLLAGDIETDVETLLLHNEQLQKVSVLKVAHHGSNTSSSVEWVQRIQPEVAIISVGRNQFGHPAPEVLERYRECGVKIIRTDQSGEVKMLYQDNKLKIIPYIGKLLWK